MLKYSLRKSNITEHADDFVAQPHPKRNYDKEAIIERMLQRGSLLTRTDILAVLNEYEETIADIVEEGNTASTPLFNTSFSISGVFDGVMDTFASSKHKLNVNLQKGTLLRKREAKVPLMKTNTTLPQPSITKVKDSTTGSINQLLTPGGVVELHGVDIKVVGDHAACGLWFVPVTGEAVKSTVLILNKPSILIVIVPQLPAGTYALKVVTHYSPSKTLKETKVFEYDKRLIVQ